jgi:hypothetical protein
MFPLHHACSQIPGGTKQGKHVRAIGDEEILLRLHAGDAYEMDGT